MTSALRVSHDTAAPPDHRHHAFHLVAFPDQAGARARRFSADIDDRGALSGHVRACRGSRLRVGELPAVGEAVGGGVDDAHHLGLVEPDRAFTELQRRPRRRQRLPLERHVITEALLDTLNRDQLGGAAAAVLDLQQLDRGEPVQAPGKARDLAIMAERRVDEACGAKKGTHARAIARQDAVAARRRAAEAIRSPRHARRSSRCTRAHPGAPPRPCGSSRRAGRS